MKKLTGKTVLVTGGGKRIGRYLSMTAANEGAKVIIHYASSEESAEKTAQEIRAAGSEAFVVQQDFRQVTELEDFCRYCWSITPFDILVNNASIFEDLSIEETSLKDWERHISVNLTAPFLLSKSFMSLKKVNDEGRIINILDWRALRPNKDHFPYTISKAALAALTKSLAAAGAPDITVNGIALGAILPPEGGFDEEDILKNYPLKRWGDLTEVGEAFKFFAAGPKYMTGDILYLDGGRHLI